MKFKFESLLVVTFLLSMVCCVPALAEITGVFPENGASQVFNYTPIEIEFAAKPSDVDLKMTPAVDGEVTWQGNKLRFVPAERFQPKTTYNVTMSWDEGNYQFSFTSVDEIQELYYEDFGQYDLWMFPNDWIPFAEPDRANFAVVNFEPAANGRALRGLDGGKDHAHAVLPSFSLKDANNTILVESNVWLDSSEFTGVYLYDAKPTWPPYVSVAKVGKHFAGEELQPFGLTVLFRLKDKKADVFVNHRVLMSNIAFRTPPQDGLAEFAVGLYFNNSSTDVYWTDVRIAEIAY
ncbi:MAG: Ig-like domain-containing protein [Limnochordia bacterium]|jgi:hypothetical protein